MTTKNLATNQFALVQFKSHISAPQNALTNNWTSSSSVCNWVGVSCGVIHEKVIALNISNMSLTGTISPHIGEIPHEIGNLLNLEILAIVYQMVYMMIYVTNFPSLKCFSCIRMNYMVIFHQV
ncbi:hypothetical protein V6N13_080423 [Hibiscus sabdariffa]